MEFGEEGQSLRRLQASVDAARECGFAAVSANDHFFFSTPWLDGPTALAAVADRTGDMAVATTIALATLRGPVAFAKALVALDVLTEGRVIAGVGPGSSKLDYEAVGIPFEDRWGRFDETVTKLRELVGDDSPLAPKPRRPGGIPVWIGSWGSEAGLRRVARLADGWLASAYNTTPERFAAARERLPDGFPNGLSTMWTWVTERPGRRRSGAERRSRATAEARRGGAALTGLRRLRGALRRGSRRLRRRGMRARLHLAARRRAAADRARWLAQSCGPERFVAIEIGAGSRCTCRRRSGERAPRGQCSSTPLARPRLCVFRNTTTSSPASNTSSSSWRKSCHSSSREERYSRTPSWPRTARPPSAAR